MSTAKPEIDFLVKRCDRIAKTAGVLTTIIGFAIIANWFFNSELAKVSLLTTPMLPDKGVLFVFLGLTLALQFKARTSHRVMWTLIFLMVLVFLIALLMLLEQTFNYSLGVEQTLFHRDNGANPTFFSSLSPLIPINFLLASCLILMLKNPRNRAMGFKYFFVILIFTTSSMSLLELIYHVDIRFTLPYLTGMPLLVSLAFIALSIGIFFSYPEYGITRIFLLNCKGSQLSWRLVPIALLMPPVVGVSTLEGQRLGLYDFGYPLVLICIVFMITFSALILWVAQYLQKIEAEHNSLSAELAYLKNGNFHQNKKIFEIISTHDNLTGLVNRTYFHKLLEHAVNRARRSNKLVGLIYINIDKFKNINDRYHLKTGDQILIETGNRFQDLLREVDIIARLGEDEYTILLEDLLDIQSISIIVGRLTNILIAPFTIKDQQITITVSMGISIYPKDGKDARALMSNANVAMTRVKEAGGNDFQFFSKEDQLFAKA